MSAQNRKARRASSKGPKRSTASPTVEARAAAPTSTDMIVEAVRRIGSSSSSDDEDLSLVLSFLSLAFHFRALETGKKRDLMFSDILHRLDALAATDETRSRWPVTKPEPDDEAWFAEAARRAALTPANQLGSECKRFLLAAVGLMLDTEERLRPWSKSTRSEELADLWLEALGMPLPEHRDVLRALAPRVRFASEGEWDPSVRQTVVTDFQRLLDRSGPKLDHEEVVTVGLRALGYQGGDLFAFEAQAAKRAAGK